MNEATHQSMTDVMVEQMERVFGGATLTEDGRVIVDGWPDAVAYDASAAVPVLQGFADRHGTTEQGDAEVCRALEQAGAVIADYRIRDPYAGEITVTGRTLAEAIGAAYADVEPAERPAHVWHGGRQVAVPGGESRPTQ